MEERRREARRHRIWEVRVRYISAFIVFLLVLFSFKLFTVSPLDGSWSLKGSELKLNVNGNKRMEAVVRSNVVEGDITVRMTYKIDKEGKTVTIGADDAEIAAAAGETMTAKGLKTELGPIIGTFEYNVTKDKMTLKDTESGEKLVFRKK